MKMREHFSVALVVLTVVALMVSAVPSTSSVADEQRPQLTARSNAKVMSMTAQTSTKPGPKSKDPIIWDNGGAPGFLYYTQDSWKYYIDLSQAADDFMFPEDMLVTGVHWWGNFDEDPPGETDPCPFWIYIYADDGTGNMPTGAGMDDPAPTALASYYFPELTGYPLDPAGYYEYDAALSPPFSASANVKYWIAIQAQPDDYGYWGLAWHNDDQLHPAVRGSNFDLPFPFWTEIVPNGTDLSFYLTGGLNQQDSLYWKPGYENYAPSGMPDIDMFQGFGWFKTETGLATFDGPCALVNCFKWFDSKYEDGFGGTPGDGFDQFPLVRDYMDQMPWWWVGYDDHDPYNINDAWDVNNFTPWLQGATVAPPPTSQPFIPGPQAPGGGLPPWGELVERIGWYVDLDGVQSGYCNHSGTRPQDMYQGIQDWLNSETFTDGSTLADTLCVNIWPQPTFELVEGLVEKCEDVILLLGFWFEGGGSGEQLFIRGDVNADGVVNGDDVDLCMQGGPFSCWDAADVNDDGYWMITDCTYLYDYVFSSGPPPPAPFPNCGPDPTPDGSGCDEFPPCSGGDLWRRVGGHWVTVAGINSEEFLIGFSDPFTDNAEQGGRGRVLDGWLIPHAGHPYPYDHMTHNDEGNVSHDVYSVIDDPVSPGGLWEIADYGAPSAPEYWIADRFFDMNVPPEFEPYTAEWDSLYPLIVEVEYAIQVSPWEYRGDVNNSGAVEAGDIVYLIGYLYRGGPAPSPYSVGDVNCDGVVSAGDIVYLLNYLFRGWPVPRCCDP
jgi:hypothetical protein